MTPFQMLTHDLAPFFAICAIMWGGIIIALAQILSPGFQQGKPSRIRILSGAHCDHFGTLETVGNTGKALVRLRDGACVWVEDGEWARIAGGDE